MSRPPIFEGTGEAFVSAFGVDTVVTLGGSAVSFPAIFRAFRVDDAMMGEMHGVEAPRYVFSARAADLAAAEQGMVIGIDGVSYRIASVTDDARAMRKLLLKDL